LGFDAGAAGGDAFEARIVSRTRMEAAIAATAPSSASGCTGLARHLLIAHFDDRGRYVGKRVSASSWQTS
jgi:hypothetical protein